jgi:hypothetical protein
MIEFEAEEKTIVSCDCRICTVNAAKLGAAEPMSATVATRQGKNHEPHFIVHTAFDPSAPARALRKQFRIEPVGYTHKTDVEVLAEAQDVVAAVRARNQASGH